MYFHWVWYWHYWWMGPLAGAVLALVITTYIFRHAKLAYAALLSAILFVPVSFVDAFSFCGQGSVLATVRVGESHLSSVFHYSDGGFALNFEYNAGGAVSAKGEDHQVFVTDLERVPPRYPIYGSSD